MKREPSKKHGQQVLHDFADYGAIFGFGVGLILALVITGPHFRDWSALECMGILCGGAFIGAVIGYILPLLAMGGGAGGDGSNSESFVDHHNQSDCSSSDSGSCASDSST